MKLFRVYNGYTGYSPVNVTVIAETEERAIELASAEFKEHCRNEHYDAESAFAGRREEFKYPESYWTNLEIHLIEDYLSVESVSGVEE